MAGRTAKGPRNHQTRMNRNITRSAESTADMNKLARYDEMPERISNTNPLCGFEKPVPRERTAFFDKEA